MLAKSIGLADKNLEDKASVPSDKSVNEKP
jgi:hypothetical protein